MSGREAENGYCVGWPVKERIAALCSFRDEEIAIEGRHMNTGWIEEVSLSIPVDALSKTIFGVVYYDPAGYNQPGMNSGQRVKGGNRWKER